MTGRERGTAQLVAAAGCLVAAVLSVLFVAPSGSCALTCTQQPGPVGVILGIILAILALILLRRGLRLRSQSRRY